MHLPDDGLSEYRVQYTQAGHISFSPLDCCRSLPAVESDSSWPSSSSPAPSSSNLLLLLLILLAAAAVAVTAESSGLRRCPPLTANGLLTCTGGGSGGNNVGAGLRLGLDAIEGAGRFEPEAFGLVGEGRTSDDDLAGCSNGVLFCGCCGTLFAEL